MRKLATLLLVAGAAIAVAPSAIAQPIRLDRAVIGTGAVVASSGDGTLNLNGTVGQAVIGPTTSSQYQGHLGFWYTIEVPTGVGVSEPVGPGSAVALQAAPNPFSDWTEIRMSLPVGGEVSLKLYDGLGREVRTLFEGVRDAGDVVVRLGTVGLESGRYTAELTAGNTRRTITLVVIK